MWVLVMHSNKPMQSEEGDALSGGTPTSPRVMFPYPDNQVGRQRAGMSKKAVKCLFLIKSYFLCYLVIWPSHKVSQVPLPLEAENDITQGWVWGGWRMPSNYRASWGEIRKIPYLVRGRMGAAEEGP